MNKNLFEVGEVVILQSVSQPECNGEYTVESIVPAKSLVACRLTGQIIRNASDQFAYYLDVSMMKSGENFEAIWQQSALRKKHKSCGEDWNIMMKGLNTKIVEVV